MNKVPIILAVLIFLGCNEKPPDGNYRSFNKQEIPFKFLNTPDDIERVPINIDGSVVEWKGTKLLKTGKHEGTVKFKSGELVFSNGEFIGGHFVVDMNSIYITDIPLNDPEPRKNLTRHLKEDFETNVYPGAYFDISHVSPISETSYTVSGDLNIKGIKRSLLISVSENMPYKEYGSSFIIDRFDWGIGKGRSWLEKKLVDAEILLNVRIVTL